MSLSIRPVVCRAAAGAALLLSLMTACKEELPKVQPPPPTVQFIEAKAADVPIAMEWIGTLAGYTTASIRSQVEGTLMKMSYEEGGRVKKDDVLFELDDRTYKAAADDAKAKVEQAKANFGKTEADVKRLAPLLAAKAVSQQDFDNAFQANEANKAAVASAQAALDKAELNLGFTKIKSPIDGIAGLAKTQVGDLVTPGNVELTTVSTVDPIKAYFTVSEQEYLRYRAEHPNAPEGRKAGEGQEFELVLANGSLHTKRGKFFASDVSVNASTGAMRLCAVFENPDNVLRPGQYARVRSVMKVVKDAIVIPQRAVNELQGIQQVAVVTPDNKAAIRAVKAGARVNSGWLIEEGLKAGDKVIVEGFMKVRDGLPVVAVPFGAPPPAAGKKPETAPAKDAK